MFPKKTNTKKTKTNKTNMPPRVDFSVSTRNAVAKAAGYRCSNPDCRKNVHIEGRIIGQIAHIIAASPNGPRASKKFEKDKNLIKSTSNGLLLCHNCAVLVDSNEMIYTVELLKGWKTQGEAIGQFQKHKCNILDELQKLESLVLSYDSEIQTEREELALYEDRMDNEVDILKKESEDLRSKNAILKKELEDLKLTVTSLRREITIKDQYITNIIQKLDK